MSHGTSKHKLLNAALVGAVDALRGARGPRRPSAAPASQPGLAMAIAESINRLAQPCRVDLALADPPGVDPEDAHSIRRACAVPWVDIRVLARSGDPIAAVVVQPPDDSGDPAALAEPLDRLAHAITFKPYRSKLAFALLVTWLRATTVATLERRRDALLAVARAAGGRRSIRRQSVVGLPIGEGDHQWQVVVLALARQPEGAQRGRALTPARLMSQPGGPDSPDPRAAVRLHGTPAHRRLAARPARSPPAVRARRSTI